MHRHLYLGSAHGRSNSKIIGEIMTKAISLLALFLLTTTAAFSDDTVKVKVGTQTYLCEITTQLNCKAVNQVQQKEILLKKNSGSVHIEDKERGLTADIATTIDNNNVTYDITLCSAQSCTLNTVTSDTIGNINQTMSGQYNITQKSFYVLAFFISGHTGAVNFDVDILNKLPHFGVNLR
jgi:hypothetical protein